jgi:hypothetical protein
VKSMTSKTLLCLAILLWPAALLPQMRPQPGKLVISSNPTGATISINGSVVSQHTNANFTVSPGNYAIVVTSPDGSFKCTGSRTVVSGQTVSVTCTAAGWQ